MDIEVQIHDDYCTDVGSEDIQAILAKITALVIEATLQNASPPDRETAAA